MAKKRRGMIIKNTDDRPVDIQMATRDIRVNPGQEVMITADEVRDTALRQNLQVRAISIVRPVTAEEEDDSSQLAAGFRRRSLKSSMNVLLLEPWYGGSHRHFVDGIAQSQQPRRAHRHAQAPGSGSGGCREVPSRWHARHRISLPGGFMPDVLLASDMVNVPAYLSLLRRELASVPVVLYFHENQLTYPIPPDTPRDYTYAYINYLSCLASDRILFNSRFHYDSFIDALPGLLKIFPDHNHLDNVQEIRERSDVLHLGLSLSDHDAYDVDRRVEQKGPPIVLWNHRWEYDKDPASFFRLMNRLDDADARFRLILAGEHFDQQPP
jgi:glycosyltransferase involved in cell wall biosynthesis